MLCRHYLNNYQFNVETIVPWYQYVIYAESLLLFQKLGSDIRHDTGIDSSVISEQKDHILPSTVGQYHGICQANP